MDPRFPGYTYIYIYIYIHIQIYIYGSYVPLPPPSTSWPDIMIGVMISVG